MKQFLLNAFAALCLVFPATAQVLLFDQTDNPTTNGLVAQDFDAFYNSYDCRIADDFVVPTSETWYIDSIKLFGFYGGTQHVDTAGVFVTIYNNNAGAIGTSVFTSTINVNLDPDEDGSIVGYWSTPIQLSAGTYWLAAAARKDYTTSGAGGIWYWRLESSNVGYTAKWENPIGGWAAGCTSWTNINASGCVSVANSGVTFQIYGCYGPTKPTINNLPEDTTFCAGPSITLTASSASSGVNYVWSNGDSTASTTVSVGGTYVVTAYNPTTLCGATSSINVNILTIPSSNLVNDTICPGETRTFGVSNCPSCTYQWSTGQTTSNITVSTVGQYLLTVTDVNTGCQRIDTGSLSFYNLPEVHFHPNDVIERCEGDTVFVTTNQVYDSYNWESSNWSSALANDTIMVTQTGTYDVTVTNGEGCTTSSTAYVTFHPLPNATYTIDYTSAWKTRLTAPEGFQEYLWSTGSTNIAIIASSSGVYGLTVTDEFGCQGSISLFIVVTGIEEAESAGIKVYPNPAHHEFNIQLSDEWPRDAKADVLNMNGQLINSQQLQPGLNNIATSQWARGSYVIRIKSKGGQEHAIPIIVE